MSTIVGVGESRDAHDIFNARRRAIKDHDHERQQREKEKNKGGNRTSPQARIATTSQRTLGLAKPKKMLSIPNNKETKFQLIFFVYPFFFLRLPLTTGQ